MKIEHLGKIIEGDPVEVAFDHCVIRALKKYGPLKSNDLWYRTGAQRVGRELFNQSMDRLVEMGAIIRQSTARRNVFAKP